MKVQFEEKTYESYFNNELDRKSSIYFPPGQVLEGVLGFDASAHTKSRKLWKIFGYPFLFFPNFSGVGLRDIASELDDILGEVVDRIPRIKINLLIQYKRPEYITTANGKEWGYWKQAYFRYTIYEEQHEILKNIDERFGGKALVLYSSPAISTLDELVKCKKNKKIIESSNFKRAHDLNCHNRNTYIKSGAYSVVCSEPAEIKNVNLLKTLDRLEGINSKNSQEFIIDTGKFISESVTDDNIYRQAFTELMNEYEEFREFRLLYAHLVMKTFREITGVQWLVSIQS